MVKMTDKTERPKDRSELPVGVFDSGVGGISVLKEMVALLPEEDFIFYGDSAHAPYGTKDIEQIRRLTLMSVENLRQMGIKAVVIACNTATSAAITTLRERFTDMPVIGIEPAVRPAVHIGSSPNVLVMATPSTVKGEKFSHLAHELEGEAKIYPLGCPGLMEFVERGELEGEQVDETLRRLLEPYQAVRFDAVVLGCTHYPFLRKAIRRAVGPVPKILDGSEGTARQLKRRLEEEDLIRKTHPKGSVRFVMTLPGREALCEKLLESRI
ncbi:MAG: glutamate racemase [Lachnospiraceae bacterium]|nr:glutamate racemase [Lachnospiraceae bacterium]